MAENFYLSQETYDKLQRVIGERDGESSGTVSGGGGRQIIHIQITSSFTDGFGCYACTPCAYNGTGWDSYTGDITVAIHPQGNQLVNGDRYIAIRYGTRADGATIYVTERGGGGYGSISSSSSSSSSTSGSGVEIVSDVTCNNGLVVNFANLTAYVTINGVNYPVTLNMGGS